MAKVKRMRKSKPGRVPKLRGIGKAKGLQGGLTEAQLKKYYQRFLHGVGESEALRELLDIRELGSQQLLFVRESLSKVEAKKLKKLLKLIKRNKKSLKAIKLIGLSVLISAFVVFNIVFKNKLVERGIERGLRSITGASVECDNAYLHWSGRLGFARLAIANPQDLRFNLIELGSTQVDISVWQLLLRKVVINEIRGEHLRWNTRREVAGVRVGKGTGQGESSAAPEKDFDLDKELKMAGIDAQGLFEQAKGRFPSLQAADSLRQQVAEAEKWPGKAEQYKKNIGELGRDVQTIDLNNISAETAPELLQKGKALASKAEKLGREVDSDIRTLDQQIGKSAAAIDTIGKNFEQDLRNFKDQVAGGDILGTPISSFLRQYVRNKLSEIGVLNKNVMSMVQRYQTMKRQKKVDGLKQAAIEADVRRRGRNYYFPGTNYPGFLIKRIFFSLGDEDAQPYMRFEVRDITNDADVMGYPPEGRYLGIDGGVETEARFLLENRSKARKVANCQPLFLDICAGLQQNFVEFELREQPFSLPEEVFAKLQMPYIHSYQAKMRTKLRLEQAELGSGAVRGILEAEIYRPRLERDGETNLLQETVASVLENNDVELEAGFELSDSGELADLQLETNIESILNRELQRLQEKALKAAIVEAEKLLREELGLNLGPMREELADLKRHKDILGSQKKQVAAREKLGSEVEGRVRKELERQKEIAAAKVADELAKEAQKIVPQVEVPKSIPKSLPKLPF
ncbi:hypothetical protein P0082_06440 [Candidatus Haliotispira prima]|uniref:TIGR03545 family protein n=1 Tax=Candidatus Haliotispira prima TaxID=3034016 RepID=A0ABY8MDR5_9SPIO|nr:hypothetical protein P0082_06440 [Candidatus Haliotispira prima]